MLCHFASCSETHRRLFGISTALFLHLLAHPSLAELRAHLYVDQILQIGSVATTDEDSDSEPPEEGPGDAEPFWAVAIVDGPPTTVPMPPFSSFTDPACSGWTKTSTLTVEQEFPRLIPGRTEAHFHVGVYDFDNYPTAPGQYFAELLGDHTWAGALDASTVALSNLNNRLLRR